MDSITINILCGIVAWCGIFLLCQYTLRYIYSYRIKNEQIQIILFGVIPIRRIPIADIQSVEKYRLSIKTLLWLRNFFMIPTFTERWRNRVLGDAILINKHGLTSHVIISPDNAEEFLSVLLGKLRDLNDGEKRKGE